MDLALAVAQLRQDLPSAEWAALERMALAVAQEAAVDRETKVILLGLRE